MLRVIDRLLHDVACGLADSRRLLVAGRAVVVRSGERAPVSVMTGVLARRRSVRRLSAARVCSMTAAKYGAASLGGIGAAGIVAAILRSHVETSAALLLALPAFALAFYVVEVQLVFLFPLAIDAGVAAPRWRDARALTARAGGTLRALSTVVPIAMAMIVGLLSRSPSLLWSSGCAAIALWYEEVAA